MRTGAVSAYKAFTRLVTELEKVGDNLFSHLDFSAAKINILFHICKDYAAFLQTGNINV
jgi:hypothetical protein